MPWEISIGSRRVALQDQISADEYSSLMNVNTEDLTELRLWALEKIKESKAKVARAYNKKISRSEILSGSWCCRLGPRIQRMEKGHPIGTVLIV